MAPAPQPVQDNAADVQNELEVISVFLPLSLLFFLCFWLFLAHVIGPILISFAYKLQFFSGSVGVPVSVAFLQIK